MKSYVFCALFVLLSGVFAYAGGQEGNGGDICLHRLNLLHDDLKIWVKSGGGNELALPKDVTHEMYKEQMLDILGRADYYKCTAEEVLVRGEPKTCRNYFVGTTPVIECNIARLLQTPESDQYVIWHHENAGLAGFEKNDGKKSSFVISDQITGFLENHVVKRLAVKPRVVPPTTGHPQDTCAARIAQAGNEWVVAKAIQLVAKATLDDWSQQMEKGATYAFTGSYKAGKAASTDQSMRWEQFEVPLVITTRSGGFSQLSLSVDYINADYSYAIDRVGNFAGCTLNIWGTAGLYNTATGYNFGYMTLTRKGVNVEPFLR